MGRMHATSIKSRGTSALVAGCLALGLGACGDDEEETTGAESGGETTALTKDAYIEQADEICASTNRDLSQVEDPLKALSRIEQGLLNLRELRAPEGEEAQVDDMLSALEQAIEVNRQARAGDRPGAVGEDSFTKFQRLAQQFGIEGGCTEAGV
jgi:hypothetical protein